MNKVILFIGLSVSCLAGCKTETHEDPSQVAKDYCICLVEQISSAKDSIIDIYDCEKIVFPSSRFMRIYTSFSNYGNYEAATIDSAKKFSLDVRNIIDTMCLLKIDSRKIKKIPHRSM